MDQRFTVMMYALENLAQDKHKYREEEHVAAQSCCKRAQTSVDCQLWLKTQKNSRNRVTK